MKHHKNSKTLGLHSFLGLKCYKVMIGKFNMSNVLFVVLFEGGT